MLDTGTAYVIAFLMPEKTASAVALLRLFEPDTNEPYEAATPVGTAQKARLNLKVLRIGGCGIYWSGS